MTLQQQAAAIFKWGRVYPSAWPKWQEWCAELYRLDRQQRGVE